VDLTETPLRRERVYDGVLLKVNRDTVSGPRGDASVREWIEHPGAAAVVPLFDDGSTLLVRQFRYPPRREFLEVPAGKIDRAGEPPEELARRELEEETGHTAARLSPLGVTYPCIGYSDEVIHLFLAEGLSEARGAHEPDDVVEPVRLPLAEAVRRARAGELLDAKTTVALLRAEAFLAEREGRGRMTDDG
jgi:ADP-ribose pyrophosphatase